MEIAAIIPAYNEEERIGKVIESAINCKLISNIIVVDDGSEDRTFEEASTYNVKVIRIPENQGKGQALKTALLYCNAEIVIFLDADLIGLQAGHIESLIFPLINSDTEMSIGVFNSGRFLTSWAQKMTPSLSGQRAFKGYLIKDIIDLEMKGYNAEMAITKLVREKDIRTEYVLLEGITQTIKEEKIGITKGMYCRMKMYKEIIKYMMH